MSLPANNLPKLNKPPFLSGNSISDKRAELKAYFVQTWALYESLFSLINDDKGYFLRPEPLRHPLIFYYGHTAVFYVNKLLLARHIHNRVDQHIESVCAVGVDEMSWDDLSPSNYQWPTVDALRAYRHKVYDLVLTVIETMPLSLPITQDSPAWLILMGCEHERIHIETSSVIMRMLDSQYLTNNGSWSAYPDSAVAPYNQVKPVAGKTVTLGKPVSNDTYGWDNEYGVCKLTVADFAASEFLVSNQEYLQFVDAGGYSKPEFWTEEGQQWLNYTQATMPGFWLKDAEQYLQRNLLEVVALPLNWPVEVNYLEAKAFCNWKSAQHGQFFRLPTEAEWQLLRDPLATDLPQWDSAPGNLNLEHYASSCPVDLFPQGEFHDVIGNVWQWSESPIDGYDGFAVHPLYDDFSTPTFDGRHNLIKGGSWISTGNEICRDSRYAFRRHFYQHAGFRYVLSPSPEIPIKPVNAYENQVEISRLLHHHYSAQASEPEHDLQQVLAMCKEAAKELPPNAKALDMGCGGGRLAFELSRYFGHVDGIDFTARNIQHCLQLKEQGQIRYALPSEGELQQFFEVNLEQLGFQHTPANLHFAQGDGHNLKSQFSDYDLIVCHRVLDKLYDPRVFIDALLSRLTANGQLILTCAYAWDETVTEQKNWLGGFKNNGENQSSADHLKSVLAESCELLSETQINSDYQLDSRNSHRACNHVTVWRKTA
ncbi:MAG: 5-histidylcysteine sulfoxide synthase/putative 4-mercaptohistidine N1-methyltransferase [Paraglaciecola sp.]